MKPKRKIKLLFVLWFFLFDFTYIRTGRVDHLFVVVSLCLSCSCSCLFARVGTAFVSSYLSERLLSYFPTVVIFPLFMNTTRGAAGPPPLLGDLLGVEMEGRRVRNAREFAEALAAIMSATN